MTTENDVVREIVEAKSWEIPENEWEGDDETNIPYKKMTRQELRDSLAKDWNLKLRNPSR